MCLVTIDRWQSFKNKTEDKEASFTICLWVNHRVNNSI